MAVCGAIVVPFVRVSDATVASTVDAGGQRIVSANYVIGGSIGRIEDRVGGDSLPSCEPPSWVMSKAEVGR